ncbi:MAG: hypothetical protein EOP19_00445 [Hyphomicrobiales bacterium]|nr:MAG: hypothetical protein EOP19_00445 [Hyphomicrobiales bacterium]
MLQSASTGPLHRRGFPGVAAIKAGSFLVASLLALVFCLAAGSAFAIDSREAIRACDANPNCNYHVSEGGVTIVVGDRVIDCPAINGECQIVSFRKSLPPVVGPLVGELIEDGLDEHAFFGMKFVNVGRVKNACEGVAGAWFSRTDSSYECLKKGCAGPGTMCVIYCNGTEGKCFGGMPQMPASGLSLVGILQNGSNIARGGAAEPTSDSSSGGDSAPSDSGSGVEEPVECPRCG